MFDLEKYSKYPFSMFLISSYECVKLIEIISSQPDKVQILSMMQQEWPQAFEHNGDDVPWPDNPDTHPTSV